MPLPRFAAQYPRRFNLSCLTSLKQSEKLLPTEDFARGGYWPRRSAARALARAQELGLALHAELVNLAEPRSITKRREERIVILMG